MARESSLPSFGTALSGALVTSITPESTGKRMFSALAGEERRMNGAAGNRMAIIRLSILVQRERKQSKVPEDVRFLAIHLTLKASLNLVFEEKEPPTIVGGSITT